MPGGARQQSAENQLESTPEAAKMADRDLIGRDEERARLADRLDRAIAGEGALVLVAGEAGSGRRA